MGVHRKAVGPTGFWHVIIFMLGFVYGPVILPSGCIEHALASTGPSAENSGPHFASFPLLMSAPPAKSAARVADSDTIYSDVPQQPPAQPATTHVQASDKPPAVTPATDTPVTAPAQAQSQAAAPAQEVTPVPAVPPTPPAPEGAQQPQPEAQPADNADNADNAGSGDGSAESNADSMFGDEDEEKPKTVEKQGPNGKITYVERPEDSKLILELALDDRVTVLTSDLEAWQVNETVLIPLGKFAQMVHFPIKVDPGAGTADGWFLKPENSFHLVTPYKAAEIAGKPVTVKGGIAETHLDDIYVSLEDINAWFPVKLSLNYNELRIYMETLTDLPFEAEAKRKAQWEKIQKAQAQQPGLDYDPKDVIKLPYRMYSAPTIQVSHGATLFNTKAGDTTSTSSSLNATMDVLGMSARMSGTFQTDTAGPEQLSGVNLNLSREDYDAQLLGPLHATRFELGDTTTGAFPLAGQQTGRGAVVTNQPYNFVSDANQFHITGFGPAGWDAEVFQDNDLLAYGTVGADGKYDFSALPLNDGFNLFKIILYGPNGEEETRYDRFYLGQNMVPQGKFYYSAAALQSSSPVLDVSASPAAKTDSTVSLTGEYGVTKYLSAMAGYFRGPIAKTDLNGVGVGLRASGGSTYAQMNAFFDQSGGQSTSALVTGNLTDSASFSINHTANINYDKGVYTTIRSTTGQVNQLFTFKDKIVPSLSVSFGAGRTQNDAGQVKLAYTNRLSTSFMGLALSNQIEVDTFDDGTPRTWTGDLSVRYRAPIGTMHAELTYVPNPWSLTAGSFTIQKQLSEKLTLNGGMSHTFGIAPATTLTGALDYKMKKVRVGLAGSVDSQHNKQIGLTVAYALIPQTLTGNYFVSGSTDDLNTGRLILRPFEDRNGDGVWEADEPLVKDVAFRNLLRGGDSRPTQDGFVNISGLTPNLANRITIDDKTLTDLSLAPSQKQIIVRGKSGVNGPVDFAFTKSGDIEGKLTFIADGEEQVLENVRMVLVDAKGKSVADTYSEYDGYFGFDDIPMGSYEIYFPASPALAGHYSGSGDGPKVKLTFDAPDVTDMEVVIEDNAIKWRNPPTESGAKTSVNENGKYEVKTNYSATAWMQPASIKDSTVKQLQEN